MAQTSRQFALTTGHWGCLFVIAILPPFSICKPLFRLSQQMMEMLFLFQLHNAARQKMGQLAIRSHGFIKSGRQKKWLPCFTMMLRVIKTRHGGRKKKRRSRFTLSSLRFLSSVVGRLNITVQLLSTDLILSAVKHKTFPGSPSCFFFFTVPVKMIRSDLHMTDYTTWDDWLI